MVSMKAKSRVLSRTWYQSLEANLIPFCLWLLRLLSFSFLVLLLNKTWHSWQTRNAVEWTTCLWDDAWRTPSMGRRQIEQVSEQCQGSKVRELSLIHLWNSFNLLSLSLLCLQWLLLWHPRLLYREVNFHALKASWIPCFTIKLSLWKADCLQFSAFDTNCNYSIAHRSILLLFNSWNIRLSLKYTLSFQCYNSITLMSLPLENSWESWLLKT